MSHTEFQQSLDEGCEIEALYRKFGALPLWQAVQVGKMSPSDAAMMYRVEPTPEQINAMDEAGLKAHILNAGVSWMLSEGIPVGYDIDQEIEDEPGHSGLEIPYNVEAVVRGEFEENCLTLLRPDITWVEAYSDSGLPLEKARIFLEEEHGLDHKGYCAWEMTALDEKQLAFEIADPVIRTKFREKFDDYIEESEPYRTAHYLVDWYPVPYTLGDTHLWNWQETAGHGFEDEGEE